MDSSIGTYTYLCHGLENYRQYEENLVNLIYGKFLGELSNEEKNIVYAIDKNLLFHEFYYHMQVELGKKVELKTNPSFDFKDFSLVKDEFLNLFDRLKLTLDSF